MKPDYVAQASSPLDRKAKGAKLGAEAGTATLPSVAAADANGNNDRGGRQSATHRKPVVAGSNPAGPAKFDKVAYQREYMRKRRAAAKEAKS